MFDEWGITLPPEQLRQRYISEGSWSDQNLGSFLHQCLWRDRDKEATVWSKTRPFKGTLGDVRDMALRVATGLRSLGIKEGDVVAFQLPNWIEAAATFYGIGLLGAVVVPIVHFYGPKEVSFILRQSGARALITADQFGRYDYIENLSLISSGLEKLETVVVVGGQAESETRGSTRDAVTFANTVTFAKLLDAEPLEVIVDVDPDSPALVAYTSGTTADPKGVIHSHRTIVFEVKQLADLQSERVRPQLVGAPVGHGIGMLSALLVPRHRGHPLNLIDVWQPEEVLKIVEEKKLAAGTGSAYFLSSLLESSTFGPKHLAGLSMIGLGGSPIPDALADKAEVLGINLVRSYGSTEHPSSTGSRHSAPREKRLYTDGCLLPEVELRIVDESEQDLDIGEAGEILSRGPDRFIGYTDRVLSKEAIDAQGWYRTGDVGRLDADGYLTVTDRKKDIIIRGGENVSAAEVEQILARMPDVAEVAVVAAPDPRLGEHGCAFFRMLDASQAPGLDDIHRYLEAAGLARQKWPEEIRSLEEFPRTSTGKIQKVTLREGLRNEAAGN